MLLSPLVLGLILPKVKAKRDRGYVPLQSGVLPKIVSRFGGMAVALAFSPDSRTLAIADTQSQIHLWNVSEHKFDKRYNGFLVDSLLWNADSLTATDHNSVQVFRAKTGTLELEFPTEARRKKQPYYFDEYNQVVASPGASTVAFSQVNGAVSLWDARSGTLRTRFKTPRRDNCGLALSNDEKMVAVASLVLAKDEKVRSQEPQIGTEIALRNVRSGELMKTLSWNEAGIERERLYSFGANLGDLALAFSPNGKRLVAASSYGIRVWDVGSGQVIPMSDKGNKFDSGGETAVYFSPDGALIAGVWNQSIGVWSVGKREIVEVFHTKRNTKSLAFSPDSQRLASGGSDDKGNGVFQIWAVSDLK